MTLDFKPILAFILIVFYTIFLKLANSHFYHSISTLIEGLRHSQKYWIIVS